MVVTRCQSQLWRLSSQPTAAHLPPRLMKSRSSSLEPVKRSAALVSFRYFSAVSPTSSRLADGGRNVSLLPSEWGDVSLTRCLKERGRRYFLSVIRSVIVVDDGPIFYLITDKYCRSLFCIQCTTTAIVVLWIYVLTTGRNIPFDRYLQMQKTKQIQQNY